MDKHYTIRLIDERDADQALEIYKPFVLHSIITFEYEVPSLTEYMARIKTNTSEFPWLVCLLNDKIIGYAYASKHRVRSAYQWSPESTVYINSDLHGLGIGRILYETLFEILRLQGYFNVYAGVGLPNEKSVGFHLSMGFEELGVFKKVGYKHGNWHDTKWFQLHLTKHVFDPPKPNPIPDIQNDPNFLEIMANANKKIKELKTKE